MVPISHRLSVFQKTPQVVSSNLRKRTVILASSSRVPLSSSRNLSSLSKVNIVTKNPSTAFQQQQQQKNNRWVSSLSQLVNNSHQQNESSYHDPLTIAAVTFLACGIAATSSNDLPTSITKLYNDNNNNNIVVKCEQQQQSQHQFLHHHWTPTEVATEDLEEVAEEHDINKLPTYTSKQVAENNGQDGKPIWMSYGGIVYDVTDFIPNHPGGSEKILMAAGSSIEQYWHLYRQHFASDLPTRLMEHMVIGQLNEKDQDIIDEQLDQLQDIEIDPYKNEPLRHSDLRIHSDQPMNAECPEHLLTNKYLTPNSLFYIRNHHPVPYLTEKEIQNYEIEIDLSAYNNNISSSSNSEENKGIVKISLEEMKKKLTKVEVTTTLQCSGNRRGAFNEIQRTSGTCWGQGAISTAKWGGFRLADVLKLAGLDDPIVAEEKDGLEHVRFHALDGMTASIGIEKAMNPYGDVILCYEMNDSPLPRDHGFPLRVIVPGYAAIRNVKWINKIELSKYEAEGPWQRGLNYKTLPPNVTDAANVELDKMPSMTEASLFSGITSLQPTKDYDDINTKPGDYVMIKATGWAWSGGGRNIVRVDVTGDDSKTWVTAELKEGSNQRFGRSWAWTFWESNVPAIVRDDGSIQIQCKSVDMAFNSQPERNDHIWNVRGLGNNSWFKKTFEFL